MQRQGVLPSQAITQPVLIEPRIQAGPERKRFIFKKDSQVEYFADEEDAK